MAYAATALARWTSGAASGSGRTNVTHLWGYRTIDTAAVVEAAGYFNAAYKRLTKGDVILAVMAAGGTPILKKYVVTASSVTAVTIALQTTAAG